MKNFGNVIRNVLFKFGVENSKGAKSFFGSTLPETEITETSLELSHEFSISVQKFSHRRQKLMNV